MGQIVSTSGSIGLQSTGNRTKTKVQGQAKIGIPVSRFNIPNADAVYSLKVTSTGAGDVATLNFGTGVVAQTTGTPTIKDGDGNDFEGVPLPAMNRVYAVLITDVTAPTSIGLAFDAMGTFPDCSVTTGQTLLNVIEAGQGQPIGSLAMSFGIPDLELTVSVFAGTL